MLVKGLFTHKVFSPFLLLPSLKFSIVPMETLQIMDRRGDNSFSLRYSDDNKKNTFNDGNGHGLKNVTF